MEPISAESSNEQVVIRADEVDAAEVGLNSSSSIDFADTGVKADGSREGSNHETKLPGSKVAEASPNLLLPSRPPLRKDQSQPPPPQQPPPPPAPQSSAALDAQNDSLSLRELKQKLSQLPSLERTAYAFDYSDTSPLSEELDEWFSYSSNDFALLLRAQETFKINWPHFISKVESEEPRDLWTSANASRRSDFLRLQLDALGDPESKLRLPAIESLVYLALGNWQETASGASEQTKISRTKQDTLSKDQMNAIRGNAYEIRSSGIHKLLHYFVGTLERYWQQVQHQKASETNISTPSEELFYAMTALYAIVGVGIEAMDSEEAALREDLAAFPENLLVVLVRMVAQLRWEDSAEFPLKQLLLLCWKMALLMFGGTAELRSVKRETSTDPPPTDDGRELEANFTSTSPLDYHLFRQEITSKYPAYNPPPPLLPFEPDNNSLLPPLGAQYSRSESNGLSAGLSSANPHGGSILHHPVHIATPAPSPPPSPVGPGGKVGKKQNYQTNQNFPFLYPASDTSSKNGVPFYPTLESLLGKKWESNDIPASIIEAGELFAGRMRMTRSVRQLWEERELFMKFERGWTAMDKDVQRSDLDISESESESEPGSEINDEAEAEAEAQDTSTKPENETLAFVEDFYHDALPHLQSFVIVLLKTLLTNVTTLVTQSNRPGMNGAVPSRSPVDVDPNSPLQWRLENLYGPTHDGVRHSDDTRSREVISKAVSGILTLILKWLKLCHILKFEFMTQLLLDSNYLPLILKLFAHQDFDKVVDSNPDIEELDFSSFVRRAASSSNSGESPSDDDDDACPPPNVPRRAPGQLSGYESPHNWEHPEVDELGYPTNEQPSEPITCFSWRNFFSSINFLRIMQKICKNKAHRNLLLVQYKSSNILKKSLRIPQPDLRLYTLKLFKGQVPFCGRKWRQNNMRVITAVYLHCRPELRDDWLAGSDIDAEVEEALPLEQALRALTHWYNLKRYPQQLGADTGVLEEEQDFFLRELSQLDLIEESSMSEEVAGEGVWEGPLHLDAC